MMRTSLLIVVPCILLAGLFVGVYKLYEFSPAAKPCAVGECPLLLEKRHSGKTFVYRVGVQFSVVLDEKNNPLGNLHCTPAGVIEWVEDAVPAFKGIAPGSCALTNDNFSATIVIE